MNFLAHIYLSGNDDQVAIGNFIGDFVKGRHYTHFPEKMQRGIQLHRAIDTFTDEHPIVRKSKKRLVPKYRHYSGVLVDIFYDHFLAKNWLEYHSTPLEDFTKNFYTVVKKQEHLLPHATKNMLQFMIPQNWLFHYNKLEGIQDVLNGMSRRTSFKSKMELALTDLESHYNEFETEFRQFFKEITAYVTQWNKQH